MYFTDEAKGIRSEIDTYPLPEVNPKSYITKPHELGLFNSNIGDLRGTCLFFDLDVVIVGEIGCLFDFRPVQFCICKEWRSPSKILLDGIS